MLKTSYKLIFLYSVDALKLKKYNLLKVIENRYKKLNTDKWEQGIVIEYRIHLYITPLHLKNAKKNIKQIFIERKVYRIKTV